MKQFLSNKALNTQWILQKYVERPLLYQGRKFDIRVWVVVNDQLDVFFYREGYIRTSSYQYTTQE